MTGDASANPDDLDGWVRNSRALDEVVFRQQRGLGYLHEEFTTSSRWGSFDASGLIGSLGAYVGYNESDAQWTSSVASAFREADSAGGVVAGGMAGGVVRMSGAAINAGLAKAGLPMSIAGSRVRQTLAEARVGRNAEGLIETVDGQPVDDYLRSVGARRAEQALDAGGARTTPWDQARSVGINRRTGEVIEGDPIDVVARAGEAGISRIAHPAGTEPPEATRLAVAHEQTELAEELQRGGEAALVPALVKAARGNLVGLRAGRMGSAALESRLGNVSSRLTDVELDAVIGKRPGASAVSVAQRLGIPPEELRSRMSGGSGRWQYKDVGLGRVELRSPNPITNRFDGKAGEPEDESGTHGEGDVHEAPSQRPGGRALSAELNQPVERPESGAGPTGGGPGGREPGIPSRAPVDDGRGGSALPADHGAEFQAQPPSGHGDASWLDPSLHRWSPRDLRELGEEVQSGRGADALHEILGRQGKNGPPVQVDQVPDAGTAIKRGVTDDDAAAWVQDFLTGQRPFVGRALNMDATGHNFMAAGSDMGGLVSARDLERGTGHIMTAWIGQDADVVDADDLDLVRTRLARVARERGENSIRALFDDLGLFAALRGHDVVVFGDHYLVLTRQVLRVLPGAQPFGR